MAWRLVADVLDCAPPNLTPAERLLLIALAERANPHTRECWPGDDELCRRTGLSLRGLRDTFTRLARHGVEVRVPLRPGMSGRGAYTRTGHRKTYRLPDWSRSSATTRAPTGHAIVPPDGAGVVALGRRSGGEITSRVVAPERHPNRQRATTKNRQHLSLAPLAESDINTCRGCGQPYEPPRSKSGRVLRWHCLTCRPRKPYRSGPWAAWAEQQEGQA